MSERIYGEWVVGITNMPVAGADHILGARITTDQKGRPEWVEVQYRTADAPNGVAQMRLDWLNALFLLSLLKSIQLDSGLPFPDDPRDPNWRAGDHMKK